MRAGETAPTEDAGPYPEVPAILLHQHVGRDLRRAEQRVRRLVDAHRLVDAVGKRVTRVDLPARLLLDERQMVRRVAVHLVGRREHEHGVGAVSPARLEQVEGARRVDAEVRERIARGPIVRGLRGRVDDDANAVAVAVEQRHQRIGVADVDRLVDVPATMPSLEFALLPGSRGVVAKEPATHVVVDADDVEPAGDEAIDRFRADKAG